MEENKKGKNYFFIVSIVFTVIIVIFTASKFYEDWSSKHKSDAKQNTYANNENAYYGNMWLVQEAKASDSDNIYMITGFDGKEPESEKIAFLVDEDKKNLQMYCSPNYYPEIYWEGEGNKQDLTEYFWESEAYGYGGLKDTDGNELTDISAAKDQVMYFNGQGTGIYGEKLKLVYQQYLDMTVIEEKDVLGYVNEELEQKVIEPAARATVIKYLPSIIAMVVLDAIIIICGIVYEIMWKRKEQM